MLIHVQQHQFREQQRQLVLSTSRLALFETTVTETLCSRGHSPTTVSDVDRALEQSKESKDPRLGPWLGLYPHNRQPLLPMLLWLPFR